MCYYQNKRYLNSKDLMCIYVLPPVLIDKHSYKYTLRSILQSFLMT